VIPLTDAMVDALRDVAAHAVDYYPGYGGHPMGYAWHAGGEIPAVKQDLFHALEVVRLIAAVPACRCGQVGSEMVLTADGLQVLMDRGEGVTG